jgi:hypothetical protein
LMATLVTSKISGPVASSISRSSLIRPWYITHLSPCSTCKSMSICDRHSAPEPSAVDDAAHFYCS